MTTTPPEQAQPSSEWESAFIAYRTAQSRLAYAGAFMATEAWADIVNPTSFARSLSRWLDVIVRVIRHFRSRQRALAQSYYQYARALEIGESLGEPMDGSSPTVGNYRNAFVDHLNDAALLETGTPSSQDDDSGVRAELRDMLSDFDESEASQREHNFRDIDMDSAIQDFLDSFESDGPDRVEVIDTQWPDRDADNADSVHRDLLENIAQELWEEEERDMDRDEALEDEEDRDDGRTRRETVADRLASASQRAGNKVAGRVMAATSHAADQVTNWAMDRDRRVYGVARGTGPNPCAMCAITAARGFAYYSVASAMTTSAGGRFTRYHENCQCYPIIRWSPNQAEPESTKKWARIYEQAQRDGGDLFNAFRRRVHAETRGHVNARRRRYYSQNKNQINARRRARRRSG